MLKILKVNKIHRKMILIHRDPLLLMMIAQMMKDQKETLLRIKK